jgi:hypothetical protein
MSFALYAFTVAACNVTLKFRQLAPLSDQRHLDRRVRLKANSKLAYAQWVTATMYQRLTERVPLFGTDAPWVVRMSFVLFVFVWFWELNESLYLLSMTKLIHQTPKQHIGFVLMGVIWGGWQLFNVVLLIGIAYRGNWARVIQLIITVFGLLLLMTVQLLNQRFHVGLLYFSNAAATALLFVPPAAAWFGRSIVQADRDARS